MITYRCELTMNGNTDIFFADEYGILDHQKITTPIQIQELDSIVWHIVNDMQSTGSVEIRNYDSNGNRYLLKTEKQYS